MTAPLNRNKRITFGYLIFGGVVLSPALFSYLFFSTYDFGNPVQLLAVSLAGTLILALASERVWIGLLCILPCTLLAPIEAFYIWQYHVPTDAHVLGILTETTYQETLDFLGVRLSILICVWLLSAVAIMIYLIRAAKNSRLVWRHRGRRWLALTSVLVIALPWTVDATGDYDLAAKTSDAATENKAVAHFEGDDLARSGINFIQRFYANTYPLGIPVRLFEYFKYQKNLYELEARLEEFHFDAERRSAPTIGSAGSNGEVHILVIGETGRPDRWQLNGYHRETNPQLLAETNLVSFTDMVSPWGWTRMSVPVILTRKPGNNKRPFFAERSIVTAFREAGYRTYWLSTQSPLGPHDSSIALHAREAHETKFINPSSFMQEGVHDGALLGPLDQILKRKESSQFIVLHTLGSHYNYSHRYPPDHDYFKPSLLGSPHPRLRDRSQKLEMNNAYDNSVRYTDHVIGEIISLLKKTGRTATLFYVADHGENLFDGDCNQSGHGRNTERDFRVASLFWYSDSYANNFPAKVEHARNHSTVPLSTMAIFPSLLDAASIGYPGEDPTASLFNRRWERRARPTQTGVDFDVAERDPVCKTLLHPNYMAH